MKNFNTNFLNTAVSDAAEPQAYVKIETSENYDIFLTTHKDIVADTALGYTFDFNGDGYIEAPRRWNPDAVDPSFVVEFYNDVTVINNAWMLSQSNQANASLRELALVTNAGTQNLILVLGGTVYSFSTSGQTGDFLWRLEYSHTNSIVMLYKDGVLFETKTQFTRGSAREPAQPLIIGSRYGIDGFDSGIMSNAKMWINGSTKETGDLVLDMPINDNSNTIVDYAPQIDGVLNAGTGQWINKAERYFLDFNGDGYISIAPRVLSGDFTIKGSFTISDTNGLDSIFAQNAVSGKNVLKIRKLGHATSQEVGGVEYTM